MNNRIRTIFLTMALALIAFNANAALKGDVNADGEVTISDVNAVIDMILSGDVEISGDVDGDGEVGIADVNAVIDIILNGGEQEYNGPVVGGDISMLTKYEAHQKKALQYNVTNAHYYDINGQPMPRPRIRVKVSFRTWTPSRCWENASRRLA